MGKGDSRQGTTSITADNNLYRRRTAIHPAGLEICRHHIHTFRHSPAVSPAKVPGIWERGIIIGKHHPPFPIGNHNPACRFRGDCMFQSCLLYTSDAADEARSVGGGGGGVG